MAIKTKLNILVVEDESHLAQHLQTIIETFNEGSVFLAENSEDAIEIVSSHDVELVLMDIVLPGDVDGIETAQKIAEIKNVPIVYLTAHSDDKYLKRLALTEPFGYLLKPVQSTELQAVLSIATQKHTNQLILENESNISTTLQKIFYPLVITDENLNIRSMNDAARKLFLFDRGKASLLKFYKHDNVINLEELVKVAHGKGGIFKDEDSVFLRLENGSILPISLTLSIVYGSLGEIKAICIMFVDLTQQIVEKNELHNKQLEAAQLLIKERLLKDILNIGKDINKALLFENSLKRKLLSSLNRIVQFANFNIANIVMSDGDDLSNFATSNNGNLYLTHKEILPRNDLFSQRLYKCLREREIDLWTESDSELPSFFNERAKHLPIKSLLLLPLYYKNEENYHGVLSIASSYEYAFSIDIVNYFEEFANSIALTISLQKHQEEIEHLKIEKLNNYEQTILSFIQVQEERDFYTKGHSQRVANYALTLAKKMGLDEKKCSDIYKAGILHDIGKIQTPDKILLKPSQLSNDERKSIEEHVEAGVRMLQHIEMYKDIVEIIKLHHERYNGTGYPNQISAKDTLISAAILQVADVFDAMTTTRVYRKSLSLDEALQELKDCAGEQFNPIVVEVALVVFKDLPLENPSPFVYSKIDQERMAYYFKDALTHLYNEEYLDYMGNHINIEQFNFVATVRLSGISMFNDTYSWCEGNKKLQQIAKTLEEMSEEEDSIAFRVHGNRFLLISKKQYSLEYMQEQLNMIVDDKGMLRLHIEVKNIKNLLVENQDNLHEVFHKLIC